VAQPGLCLTTNSIKRSISYPTGNTQ
jgi:hypothetical protein